MDAFRRIQLNLMYQVEYRSNSYYLLKSWKDFFEINVFPDNTPVCNNHFHKKMNKRQLQDIILNISESLALGFRLKEIYLHFNKTTKEDDCAVKSDSLIVAFNESGISEYNKFVSMLINWRIEILKSFKRPFDDRKLSNVLCENINGQIRSYLTISNGVSNFSRFRKICILALNPHVFYSTNNRLKTDMRNSKPRGNYKFKYHIIFLFLGI